MCARQCCGTTSSTQLPTTRALRCGAGGAWRAWPTFMFVGPEGTVLGKHEGEFDKDALDRAIAGLIADFRRKGVNRPHPNSFQVGGATRCRMGRSLSPGKVMADKESDTLVVADSNHNRLVVAGLDGRVRAIVGSGAPGLTDGDFASARFRDPQGLALAGDQIYVADTKNHAIRPGLISLRGIVITLAGTGQPAPRLSKGGPAKSTPIKSPWDVALRETKLYIAMAGFHQIWRLDLVSGFIAPHAGSGRENIVDGPLLSAQLAQPSGIVSEGSKLYFADSETSAIRTADMDAAGVVSTIVGEDLFSFGDLDGPGKSARLQHPIGVDLAGGFLYLTDTYNNRIKRIELVTGEVTTLFGTGQPGLKDGYGKGASFHEPGGPFL